MPFSLPEPSLREPSRGAITTRVSIIYERGVVRRIRFRAKGGGGGEDRFRVWR